MKLQIFFGVIVVYGMVWASPTPAADAPGDVFKYTTNVNYEAGSPLLLLRPTNEVRQADFSLWLPKSIKKVRCLVAISQHGSGADFFANQQLRQLAAEMNMGLVGFIGDGVQRGMRPRVLEDALSKLAAQAGHQEITAAPMFTFGMSNGTGFSCGYACMCPERVVGWIAYHPGNDALFSRECDAGAVRDAVSRDSENAWLSKSPPPLYAIPGLVVVGELDALAGLSKGTREKPDGNTQFAFDKARREHNALMQFIVEPGAGHEHIEGKSWTIVLAFIKSVFEMRVPAEYDATQGLARLKQASTNRAWLGKNRDAKIGGGQDLAIIPESEFNGDRGTTSWLPNEAYAKQWKEFCRIGTARIDH
jgi:hypothetical protein